MASNGGSSHSPYPGPVFDVKFTSLSISTGVEVESQIQYHLDFVQAQVISSLHRAWIRHFLPHTTCSAEETFKMKKEKMSTLGGDVMLGAKPVAKIGAGVNRWFSTEKILHSSKIAAFPNCWDGDKTIMKWDYTIDDEEHCRVGWQFEENECPFVKFAYTKQGRPNLEVEVLAYWSTTSNTSRGDSNHFRWFPFKEKKLPPVFTNLLQLVSVSIPLDKLKGKCWVEEPSMGAETSQPSMVDKLQCYGDSRMPIEIQGNPLDLEVAFACALYSKVKPGKSNNHSFCLERYWNNLQVHLSHNLCCLLHHMTTRLVP